MEVELMGVGGYSEIGRNMTALRVNDEVVIFDMGLQLENYIKLTEHSDIVNLSASQLTKVKAVPNLSHLGNWKNKVKAIIPSHAHLDHLGAIPFLANKFNAPIICTPFSAAVLRLTLQSEKIKLRNEIIVLNSNQFMRVGKLKIDFNHVTHSTPHTVMVGIHTPKGVVIYANDFKLDNSPTLGKKPNYNGLGKWRDKGVLCLIMDSLYAWDHRKMPSERVAKEMLKDVMLGVEGKNKAIIATTFASHIARLKSIIQFGEQLNRKIVFLGRSLYKYTKAAEEVDIVHFSDRVEVVRYGSQIKRRLRKVTLNNKSKYLFVVTGHQGEPQSTLAKIASGQLPFPFSDEDHIIFSCNVIPSKTNIANREHLEEVLRAKGARIFKGMHASGHGAAEDQRDLIKLLQPKHIIPSHGDVSVTSAVSPLAKQLGYRLNKTLHILQNSDIITF